MTEPTEMFWESHQSMIIRTLGESIVVIDRYVSMCDCAEENSDILALLPDYTHLIICVVEPGV